MYRLIILFSFFLVLLFGKTRAQCPDQFLETQQIVLSQESQLLGSVESATVLSDGSLALATADPGLFIFDADGTFVREIGQSGRGPFEYQGPLTVRPLKDGVAAWDAGNRKLLEFTIEGARAREWSRLGRAVSDFAVHGDTLFAYHGGGISEDYVSVYHYQDQGAPVQEFGNAPGEHFALSLLEGSGDLAYDTRNTLLLYASPAEPVVHLYDPSTGTRTSWRIEDPDFTTEAVSEYTSLGDVNTDLLGAAEQAMRSSRFYFLNITGDRVLSVLQHGELVYRKSFAESVSSSEGGTAGSFEVGGVETNTRSFHVYLHTLGGDALACESLSFNEGEVESDSPIVGPTPRGFFVLNVRTKEDELDYVLTKYSVPQS